MSDFYCKLCRRWVKVEDPKITVYRESGMHAIAQTIPFHVHDDLLTP